jgi:iron-sulfur cluster repair protein YtfE (RIC family)
MAFRDQPLGELALSIPRASALFRKYDMDYCCGGKQTLARAASRKELDVEVIEAELAKLADSLSRKTGAPHRSQKSSTTSSCVTTTVTVNSCQS